jgi:hypothetical protein
MRPVLTPDETLKEALLLLGSPAAEQLVATGGSPRVLERRFEDARNLFVRRGPLVSAEKELALSEIRAELDRMLDDAELLPDALTGHERWRRFRAHAWRVIAQMGYH